MRGHVCVLMAPQAVAVVAVSHQMELLHAFLFPDVAADHSQLLHHIRSCVSQARAPLYLLMVLIRVAVPSVQGKTYTREQPIVYAPGTARELLCIFTCQLVSSSTT